MKRNVILKASWPPRYNVAKSSSGKFNQISVSTTGSYLVLPCNEALLEWVAVRIVGKNGQAADAGH